MRLVRRRKAVEDPHPPVPIVFHVVLYQPEIPPNTGNIGRLCLATGARLHLVRPLGFSLDAKALRRAGLDYWDSLDFRIWESFGELRARARSEDPGVRFFLLTTKATTPYWSQRFQRGDHLVFGPETRGLPAPVLEEDPGSCLNIPMAPGGTRSLNLATAAGIVLYEAVRQTTPGDAPPQPRPG